MANIRPPGRIGSTNPSDAKLKWAVPSYPTPNYKDVIYTELVNTETNYTPLEYGTEYNSVEHGANTGSKPGFQLVFQEPADINGTIVRRWWVNNRTDQNAYNSSTEYAEGDPEFPTITRVYVYPRDTYPGENGPLEPLSDDPKFPDAKLVQERQLNETTPEQISSKYITVVRVYQTVPGPVVLTQDFDPQLNMLAYTSRQVVLASDTFTLTPLTLDMRESNISKYIKLRIHSYLQELPEQKVEYRTGRYPFPTLVFGITKFQGEIAPTPNPFSPADPLTREEVALFPIQRPGPEVPAILKLTTQWGTVEPAPATLYAFGVQNLYYQGISFQVSISNVLNDEITISADFTDDGRYGNLTESQTFAASTPSATEYQDTIIGTYQTVGSDITRWRGAIWITATTDCLML